MKNLFEFSEQKLNGHKGIYAELIDKTVSPIQFWNLCEFALVECQYRIFKKPYALNPFNKINMEIPGFNLDRVQIQYDITNYYEFEFVDGQIFDLLFFIERPYGVKPGILTDMFEKLPLPFLKVQKATIIKESNIK